MASFSNYRVISSFGLIAGQMEFKHLIQAVLNGNFLIAAAHTRKHVTQFTRVAFGFGNKERIKRALLGAILPNANFPFTADHFRRTDFGLDRIL